MKAELDKQLCEKYPKIFRDRYGDPAKTCMCWGIAVGDGWYNIIDQLCYMIQWRIDQRLKQIGYAEAFHAKRNAALAGDWTLFNEQYDKHKEKNPEWVERARAELLGPVPAHWAVIEQPIPQVIAAQVKEKFGGLRFYADGGDEVTRAYINMAEAIADVTCEQCGAPGKLRQGGWVVTLCDQHAEEREQKRRQCEQEDEE